MTIRCVPAILAALALAWGGIPAAQAEEHVVFVFFGAGASDIPSQYEQDLKDAACRVIHAPNPNLALKFQGYADRTGNPKSNLRLSTLRAVNVLNMIGAYGVPCPRLTEYQGFGEEDAPGQAENRPFSRRVEVLIEGARPSDNDAIRDCIAKPAAALGVSHCAKLPD